MNQQKINEYKNRLEKDRAALLANIKEKDTPEYFGSDQDHFDEEADEAESMGMNLAIGSNLRERVNEIDVALQRIADGKYGFCEKCGQAIEEEILNIAPESKLCKKCKVAA